MVEVTNKQLAVEMHGDGDWMIMVHGLGGTSNVWAPQIGALSPSFRILTFDLEGSGRSPAKGQLSMDSFVRDTLAVMTKYGIEAAHFAGHSMGTIVCQHMAAKHPDRVLSLTLLGPLPEPPEPARPALKDRAATARRDGMIPIADTIVQVATSEETKRKRPGITAFVREIQMGQSAEGYARTCEALSEAVSADLSAIKCPTLLITGDEDKVGPPSTVEAMAKKIKGAKTLILEGCGHWTPIEKPLEVNEALVAFYKGLKKGKK
jgi:3-oxoadipate enol-lactonase